MSFLSYFYEVQPISITRDVVKVMQRIKSKISLAGDHNKVLTDLELQDGTVGLHF